MQTHPSQLKYLLEKFEEGTHDIVYGYYPHKKAQQIPEFRQLYQFISLCGFF